MSIGTTLTPLTDEELRAAPVPVVTQTEAGQSAFDQDFPDPWNTAVTPTTSGFPVTNQLTIDNVWE